MSSADLINAINAARRAQSSNQDVDAKIAALGHAIEAIARALQDIQKAVGTK